MSQFDTALVRKLINYSLQVSDWDVPDDAQWEAVYLPVITKVMDKRVSAADVVAAEKHLRAAGEDALRHIAGTENPVLPPAVARYVDAVFAITAWG